MEVFRKILIEALSAEKPAVSMPDFSEESNMIVETECFRILCEIQEELDDSAPGEQSSFYRIRAMLSVLEKNGLCCVTRPE